MLVITEGVDDYKSRGNCASSTVYLYSKEEYCYNKLQEYIAEHLTDKQWTMNDVPENLKSFVEEVVDEGDEEDPMIVLVDQKLTPAELSDLHDWIAEGECVPYAWTYFVADQDVDEYV